MTMYQEDFREIITKAVCGSGSKAIQSVNEVIPNQQPSSILGCWIINHEYRAQKQATDLVKIEGSYDINVWYSFHENSKTEVVTEQINYTDEIPLSTLDEHSLQDFDEVIAKVVKQPNCLQCSIGDGKRIQVEIEREFMVEVIGETKVNVRVTPMPSNSSS